METNEPCKETINKVHDWNKWTVLITKKKTQTIQTSMAVVLFSFKDKRQIYKSPPPHPQKKIQLKKSISILFKEENIKT